MPVTRKRILDFLAYIAVGLSVGAFAIWRARAQQTSPAGSVDVVFQGVEAALATIGAFSVLVYPHHRMKRREQHGPRRSTLAFVLAGLLLLNVVGIVVLGEYSISPQPVWLVMGIFAEAFLVELLLLRLPGA